MNLLLQFVPLAFLAVLLCLMRRNRAYKVCPWFFAYVAFGNVADLARWVTHNHPHPFFAAYWLSEAGYCVLGILSMYEVLRGVLEKLACAWWANLIFPAILSAGVSLSLSLAHAAPPQFSGIFYYIVVGEIAVRCVQVLVFVATVATVLIVGSLGRKYLLGVATGFGFYATVMLLSTTTFLNRGSRFKFAWGRISIAAYSLAALLWIWSFARPRPQERRHAPPGVNLFPGRHRQIRQASTIRIGAPL